MADTVTITTTTDNVTITPSGGTSVSLTSADVNTVTIGVGVGVVNLAGQTTDGLSEGTGNLYHTTARALAAAPIQSVGGSTGVTITTDGAGAVSVVNTKLGTVTGVTMPSGYTVADASGALTVAVNNQSAIRTGLGLGTASVLATGTGVGDVIIGNDARLTDDRTPVAHSAALITSGTLADARVVASNVTQHKASINIGDLGNVTVNALISDNQLLLFDTSTSTFVSGSLAAAEIPSLSTDKLTSGTLPVARGGTGLTAVTTLLNSNTTKSDVGLGNVTNIEAQPVDADLTALAGLTSAADKGIQFTGSGTAGGLRSNGSRQGVCLMTQTQRLNARRSA